MEKVPFPSIAWFDVGYSVPSGFLKCKTAVLFGENPVPHCENVVPGGPDIGDIAIVGLGAALQLSFVPGAFT